MHEIKINYKQFYANNDFEHPFEAGWVQNRTLTSRANTANELTIRESLLFPNS